MKKVIYFIPAIIGAVFYLILSCDGQFFVINPMAWVCVALLIISGILMVKRKWWGSLFGIIVGGLLIYFGTQDKGQIVNEIPIGIALCAFYVALGIYILRREKHYVAEK